jgi:hypothetical protein
MFEKRDYRGNDCKQNDYLPMFYGQNYCKQIDGRQNENRLNYCRQVVCHQNKSKQNKTSVYTMTVDKIIVYNT